MPTHIREVSLEVDGVVTVEIVDTGNDARRPAIDAFLLKHPEIDPQTPEEAFCVEECQ